MTTTTLEKVQDALQARGVQDIKFLFNLDAHGALPTEVLEDVANVLEKVFSNQCEVVPDFSQEIKPQPITIIG